jgi:hypothetical protein
VASSSKTAELEKFKMVHHWYHWFSIEGECVALTQVQGSRRAANHTACFSATGKTFPQAKQEWPEGS